MAYPEPKPPVPLGVAVAISLGVLLSFAAVFLALRIWNLGPPPGLCPPIVCSAERAPDAAMARWGP